VRYHPSASEMPWGATVDGTVAEGFRVLAAIAAGADAPGLIASRLDLSERAVDSHLESLASEGFVRRDGARVVLADRVIGLLDGLVGRIDLLAIAAPIVLETETRLGLEIEVEVPREPDPRAFVGSAPFAVVAEGGSRQIVACVLDAAAQTACVLRMHVDGAAPEAIEVLGKELVATADAIGARLPHLKDRGPDWRLRS
jgi:DNA-binding transcriptional ArsR family regulator